MFKNKYFIKDSHFNKKFVTGLNKLSQQSERMEILEQELELLKAKNCDAKQEIKTNDGSDSTPGKSRHEDFFDREDQQIVFKHFEDEDDHSSEICGWELNLQHETKQQSPRISQRNTLLWRGKLLIEKLLRRQAHFIAQLNSKRISRKLKLLLIQKVLRMHLNKYIVQEPQLWQICQLMLDQVFLLSTAEANKENYLLVAKLKQKANKQWRKQEQSRRKTTSSSIQQLD